jgi:hypothetical protein
MWLTAKGAGRGKHKTIQVYKRHESFSFEYSLRHSANSTQQHRITVQQPINNQQEDRHVTAIIEMERPKQN